MYKISHVKTDIHSLVKRGNLSKIRSLLKKQPDLVNATDEAGETPLFFAPNTRVMELLIASGADVNAQSHEGHTILNQYAACMDVAMIKLLIDSGADVNKKDDYDGWTPLMSTLFSRGLYAAEFLIAMGADVNAQDNNGATALHLASCAGHLGLAELLIRHGADIHIVDVDGVTPLFEACKVNPEIVRILVAKGAEVNEQNENGITPLQMATMFGEERSVDILLLNGADIDVEDLNGNTPAHWSVLRDNPEIYRLLRLNGADFDRENKAGLTPKDMMHVMALQRLTHYFDDECEGCEEDCQNCRPVWIKE